MGRASPSGAENPARRVSSGERREQVVSVAYSMFARGAFEGATMEAIATEVGVAKQILYRLFTSKEELYAVCAGRFATRMVAEVDLAARAEQTADGQLWAGIVAQLRFIEANDLEYRAYVQDASLAGGVSSAALAQGRAQVIALLAELIAHASRTAGAPAPPERECQAMAHALQGTVERISDWWQEHPEETAEAVALRAMNFAWQGFGSMVQGSYWSPPAK